MVFKINFYFLVLGSILVFLPGYDDIINIRDQMSSIFDYVRIKPIIFTLHSQINTQEQQKVFDRVAYGERKVVCNFSLIYQT